MFKTKALLAEQQKAIAQLQEKVTALEERVAAAEARLEQRYVSDTTREANNAKDARDILTEYLFGEQPEAK